MEGMGDAMNIAADPLQDVPAEDIPDMLFRMQNNFPLAIHAHEYIKTMLKWKKMKPDLEVHILAPGGDYKRGVCFFTLHPGEFNGSVFCMDDEEKNEMQKALASSKRVPFYTQKFVLFTCMTSKSYEAIKHLVPDYHSHDDTVLWLPWYCAREMEVQLPVGVEIRKLETYHAEEINEVWPHRYEGSRELIAEMIRVNFGLGIFRGDKLVSWALHWFYGGIGVVQTAENEKRKGYGRAVVQAITKKMGEQQIDIHLNVVHRNKVAESFFRQLGFRYAFTSHWVSK